MVYLSVLNREKIADFIDKNIITSMPMRETIEHLHQESIDKIIDLFQAPRKIRCCARQSNRKEAREKDDLQRIQGISL